MTTKMEKTTPFKEGQNTNDHKGDAPKAPIKSNMSKVKGSGVSDALHAALSHRDSYIPSDNHVITHTTRIEPAGAHYEPRGEFGRVQGRQAVPATSMKSHTSKPGQNALGKALNKVGQKSGYPAKGGGKHA